LQAAYLVRVLATGLNRYWAPYRYVTPYSDLTLLPFTALIRYQSLLEYLLPLQVALQLPPVTLATTVTFVPVLTVARILAVVEALVRRLTPQAAIFVELAPSVSAGAVTAETPKTINADSKPLMRNVGSDGRPVRRD
jgi:hypothetical protein